MVNTMTLGAEVWTVDLALIKPVISARDAFDLLEAVATAGVPLERLDDVEPVRRPYSKRTIEEILGTLSEDAPCRIMVGRGTKNQGSVSARFCRPVAPSAGSLNVISVQTGRRKAEAALALATLAKEWLADGKLGWGFVDRAEVHLGQRMPGTLNDRLDGVFWANAFSSLYVEAIGEERLLSVPWARVDRTPNGLMTWLYDDPGVLPADLIERRHEARRAIGEEKFMAGRWSGLPQLGRSTSLGGT